MASCVYVSPVIDWQSMTAGLGSSYYLLLTSKMDVGLVVLVLPNMFKFVLKPKQWKSIN